jgi:phytol kinase
MRPESTVLPVPDRSLTTAMSIPTQLLWVVALGLYVLAVLFGALIPYRAMVAHGMEPIRAIYYNRKLVHMLAGGVGSLMVPLVFTDPWYPLVAALLLTLLTFLTHGLGRRLYWFQTPENRNDVKFALMWACSVSGLWWLMGDPWLAILPSLYMAFGDGVTGIVRNLVVRRRSKSPIGSVFMLWVSVPMGWVIGGQVTPPIPEWGILSAVVATLVERYEFGPIDDNVLITLSASAVLLLGVLVGPL